MRSVRCVESLQIGRLTPGLVVLLLPKPALPLVLGPRVLDSSRPSPLSPPPGFVFVLQVSGFCSGGQECCPLDFPGAICFCLPLSC